MSVDERTTLALCVDAPDDLQGLAFRKSPLPMWVEDEATGRLLAINDAAIAKYGYGRGEFLAASTGDLEVGAKTGGVLCHRRADGTTFDIKIERTRLEVDGRIVSFAVSVEGGLPLQPLHDAVNYVNQPFVVYDADDRVIAFNSAFVDLHRQADGRVAVHLGASFADIARWEVDAGLYVTPAGERAVDFETLVARHRAQGQHRYNLRDGRWMLVTYRLLPGGATVGVLTDMTAIKRAEEEKQWLEEQLHHAQRLDGLGTLAGGIAHEINNALVPVIALTELVASHLPEESRDRRSLASALAGAERSRDLVKQILAFSRKEEHRRESFDPAAMLHEALLLMRATVPTSIRLEADIVAGPPLLGDSNQLHQVVVNLVTNAAQAIGEGHGTISVGLRPESHGVHIWVADTGCGMDEATQARIFEPFFTTKAVGMGAGLGLAVVHGIVKSHGGRIDVRSTPGKGSHFDLRLPLAPPEASAA
jgi:signal transduction histidine kinase